LHYHAVTTTRALPKTVFGYNVIDRIGEGAHSDIYVVEEPKTRQVYALKHVVPKEEKDLRFIDQLRNEHDVSRTFRHPALRKAVDLKIKKGIFGLGGITEAALVLEMVDGATLDYECPRDVTVLVDVFQKVAVALAAMHRMLLVHCDLKPGNIIRDEGGRVKIIDFGQACRIGTVKERVQGTPDFIAPEQVRCRPLKVYTDVYNLGATMYWGLSGGRKAPTLFTVAKSERHVVKEQLFSRPHELNPAVPEELSELVMDCIRVSPAFRPRSMDEVLERLAPFGMKGRSAADAAPSAHEHPGGNGDVAPLPPGR
jgi:serine/threonine protein kinase